MKRLIASSVVATAAMLGGFATGAAAQHDPGSHGCLTVASKYMDPTAPGHRGVAHAAEQGTGEGPCGFGDPPRQN
ncbi:MAG TPA: hypothetical protein VGR26_13850 [Acidimicrobiales bacterium]|nr:hypothetical protein [Acidimicrobiales bacterium]